MKYKLTSQREESVTIDGLGVLPPVTREEDGTTTPSETEFDAGAVERFRLQRGLHVTQVHLPEGVEVTIVLEGAN